jgi:hypothetical protein
MDEPITDLEGRENLLTYLAFLRQRASELPADASQGSGSFGRASRMIQRAFGKDGATDQE